MSSLSRCSFVVVYLFTGVPDGMECNKDRQVMVLHLCAGMWHGSSYSLLELYLPGCDDISCSLSFEVP